jgi:hypothetical protein
VHGHQQLSLFHAHHDSHGFLPIHIDEATTGKPVAIVLRPGKTPDGAEVALVLRHVVRAIRRRWPAVDILVRGDSHYGRPEAMTWLERNRVGYVFGLGGNKVLLGKVGLLAADAAVGRIAGEAAKARRYGEFRYAAKTWHVQRQVIARVEASAIGFSRSPGGMSAQLTGAPTAGSSSPTSRARRGGCTRRSTAPAAIGLRPIPRRDVSAADRRRT